MTCQPPCSHLPFLGLFYSYETSGRDYEHELESDHITENFVGPFFVCLGDLAIGSERDRLERDPEEKEC